MSVARALEFLKQAPQDQGLRERLEACSGREAIAQLTRIASEAGYVFSQDDYREAVRLLAEGELDQAALDEVMREAGFE